MSCAYEVCIHVMFTCANLYTSDMYMCYMYICHVHMKYVYMFHALCVYVASLYYVNYDMTMYSLYVCKCLLSVHINYKSTIIHNYDELNQVIFKWKIEIKIELLLRSEQHKIQHKKKIKYELKIIKCNEQNSVLLHSTQCLTGVGE